MDLGSLPCACGLAVRPRRPFGITKSTAEAPSSGTGLAAPGANGLSADTAPFMLRRRGPFLIQGAHEVRVSKGGQRQGKLPTLRDASRSLRRAQSRGDAPQGEVVLFRRLDAVGNRRDPGGAVLEFRDLAERV